MRNLLVEYKYFFWMLTNHGIDSARIPISARLFRVRFPAGALSHAAGTGSASVLARPKRFLARSAGSMHPMRNTKGCLQFLVFRMISQIAFRLDTFIKRHGHIFSLGFSCPHPPKNYHACLIDPSNRVFHYNLYSSEAIFDMSVCRGYCFL